MQKTIKGKPWFAGCLAAVVLANAGAVAASPPTLSGDVKFKWEAAQPADAEQEENFESTLRLRLEGEAGRQAKWFVRYGLRDLQGDASHERTSRMDQYGLRWGGEGESLTLGAQDVILGPWGSMVDLTDNVGNTMLTGADWQTHWGQAEVRLLGGRLGEDLFADQQRRHLWGVEVGGVFGTAHVALAGLTLSDVAVGGHYWQLSASQPWGKAEVLAEVLRSNAGSDKRGWVAGVAYHPTEQDTFSLHQRRLEAQAVPEGLGGYDADSKALELDVSRTLTDNQTLTLKREWSKTISGDVSNQVTSVEWNLTF